MTWAAPLEWVVNFAKKRAGFAKGKGPRRQMRSSQAPASSKTSSDNPKSDVFRPSSNQQGENLALVVSFPKSGRTWLRVMLDELGVPCSYSHDRSSHKEALHLEELGDPGFGLVADRFVFIHRDPRDTAVSGYFQATKRLRNYDDDISAFIRDPHHGIEKIARFNLGWLTGSPGQKPVYALSYEELTAHPQTTLQALVDWLGVEVTTKALETVVADNTFDKMQKREVSGFYADRYGSALKRPDENSTDGLKVRRGQVGGFRDDLAEKDIAYCDAVLARLNYWQMLREAA